MKQIMQVDDMSANQSQGRTFVAGAAQVVLLCGIWMIADALARRFALPVSGGVLGLLALIGLLLCGALPIGWIKRGADWMLAEMLLFFVPAVVAIVKYMPLFRHHGLQLVAVIALSTVMVMVATALTVEWAWRVERRWARRSAACRVPASRKATQVKAR